MIVHEQGMKEFSDKLIHVHAKDSHIDRDGLYNNGVLSWGMRWQIPRLPDLGDVDWAKFNVTLQVTYMVSGF